MACIAIVGVGAIGAVVAVALQATGQNELVLCSRRPVGPLRVDTPTGPVLLDAVHLHNPIDADAVEWIIVTTKTYQSAGAAQWLERLVCTGTRLAIVQNGVEHRETFAPLLPDELALSRVLPVIIDTPAERREDGSVLQRTAAVMKVEDTPLGRDFAELFAGSGATVELTADFTTAAWRKLCLNAAGAVSAWTGKPAGVFADEAMGQLALELMREAVLVGRAEGADLSDDLPEQVLAGYRAGPPEAVNSLLADRLAGRPMETDARNGVIVRRGKQHGISTPANAKIVEQLRAIEERAV